MAWLNLRGASHAIDKRKFAGFLGIPIVPLLLCPYQRGRFLQHLLRCIYLKISLDTGK